MNEVVCQAASARRVAGSPGWSMKRGESVALKLMQANPIRGDHLVGQRDVISSLPAAPHHHRRDDVAGPRRVVVQQAKHGLSPTARCRVPRPVPAARRRPRFRPHLSGLREVPTARREPCNRDALRHKRNAAPPDTSTMRPSRSSGIGLPCDPVVDGRRVDPVLADFGVDEHHRDGRVPLRRIGHFTALVARQTFLPRSAIAQRVVVGDGHRSTIGGDSSIRPRAPCRADRGRTSAPPRSRIRRTRAAPRRG